MPSIEFQSLNYLNPSITRLAKAAGIWRVKQGGSESFSEPLVIVAIRGTAGALDAMVNLNGEKKDLGILLVSLVYRGYGLNER